MELTKVYQKNGVSNNRIMELDIARGVGILLVILGHMETLTSDIWKQFGASFHMPLFFVVSGLLFSDVRKSPDGFLNFLRKKALHILVPYFLWALIYSSGFNIKQILCIVYSNNKVYAEAGLWFLPTLFVSECLFYFICYVSNNNYCKIIFMVLCGLASFVFHAVSYGTIFDKYGYPFSFDIALMAVAFIGLGNICKPLFQMMIRGLREEAYKKYIYSVCAIVLLAIVFVISRVNYSFLSDHAFERVVMARASYGFCPLFIIGGVLGSLAVIFISSFLSTKAVVYIGKNSLIFMCMNHFWINVFMLLLDKLPVNFENSIGLVKVLIIITATIFVVIGCSIGCVIVNRFIPILNGKTIKQNV